MSPKKLLVHFFVPHESNNQKAKILHTSSLSFLVIFLAGFQLLLNILPKTFPSVLGYAANISPAEVIQLTNEKRAASGLTPLAENKALDAAALAKGQDMLSKGYWAHFAPDGTSPWNFFIDFGYKYQYAGENLARDFSSAQGAVAAWMNSASHKENILNPHYKETGIAVVEGSLSGADTTLIVQFFGSPLIGKPSIPIAKAEEFGTPEPTKVPDKTLAEAREVVPTTSPTPTIAPTQTPVAAMIKPVFSPFNTTKNISLGITGIILLVLSIDLIIVRRRRIVRIGGRSLAHIAYLSMILAVILILKAGQIL